MPVQETYECDVLVIGSGASGMSAAVTAAAHSLKVLVIEKEAEIRRHNGPIGRLALDTWDVAREGVGDQRRAKIWPKPTFATRRATASTVSVSTRLSSNGPKAVDFFITQTSVRFDMPLVFPDYHAEAPGGTQGGRSMVARPFDGKELGDNIKNLAPALPELTVFGMMLGSGKEIVHFMRATRSVLFRILRCEAAFKALRPSDALRPRHDPDERQRACRPSSEIGLRSWRSALAVLAGQGIDRRERSG